MEVLHDRTDINAPAWYTMLKITIEVPGREALEHIVMDLEKDGIIILE